MYILRSKLPGRECYGSRLYLMNPSTISELVEVAADSNIRWLFIVHHVIEEDVLSEPSDVRTLGMCPSSHTPVMFNVE